MSTQGDADTFVPNRVLVERRSRRGWGRGRLAAEFERAALGMGLGVPSREALAKAIYRHETGRSAVIDDMYRQLYCTVYDASPHDLFGDVTMAGGPSSVDRFALTSHKFVPVFVGADGSEALSRCLDGRPAQWEWTEGWSAPVEHPHGTCTVYGLPWGAIVFHIKEPVSGSSIAHVAAWRQLTHEREQTWVDSWLAEHSCVAESTSEYVLSAFWVREPTWTGASLDTAMRLLCTPRVLLSRTEPAASTSHAELIEQTLLREGYDDPRIVSFGVQGISVGYASWSGVAYHPLAESRALEASRFVTYQVVVQGLWTYCNRVRSQVEGGQDPVVQEGYGWRWLRGMKSKLEGARPQETGQHAAMREAILHTSELSRHMATTLEVVRDCATTEKG